MHKTFSAIAVLAALATLAFAAERTDLTKPLYLAQGQTVCGNEEDLKVSLQGAPGECWPAPGGMHVAIVEQGGFPWQTARVRVIPATDSPGASRNSMCGSSFPS